MEKKGKTSYKIELHYENFKNEILHFMYVYVSTYIFFCSQAATTSVNKANKSRKVFSGDGFYFCIIFNALLKRDFRTKTQGTEVKSIDHQ